MACQRSREDAGSGPVDFNWSRAHSIGLLSSGHGRSLNFVGSEMVTVMGIRYAESEWHMVANGESTSCTLLQPQ
ncbi:Os03g0803950 [Oryza sativa Japonica Group]|uniref:Os03g0803950 protein n=1 Tax=Oryza sativa subsp. japonica TaxID=39947 RepID=A0A0P0W4X9_ORYSJ|nr:Os03g0803950 [Oryza sativa Japonica Group]